MLIRSLIALLALAAATLAAELPRVEPDKVGLSAERLERVSGALASSVEAGHVSGAIGVVMRDGRIAYWKTVGMADREAGTPLRDDTVFRIYSMTKPIVGVALMTLYEEGKFSLRDPVKDHIPELGGLKVLKGVEEMESKREMTVQDLLRHTAGMTYGLFGKSPVDKLYNEANVLSGNESVDHFVKRLAKLPLKHQPGSAWDYSVSVDVQGRLIEVLSGMDLATFLQERIFVPLDMPDTSFRLTPDTAKRFVKIYEKSEDGKGIVPVTDGRMGRYTEDTKWYSGGGGLVSTARDYLRFCQMMLNGGELDGQRILSRKTVELMTIDHVEGVRRASPILPSGWGFGLGFAVHTDPVRTGLNSSRGNYRWGGLAGTDFWIDPSERLVGLYLIQVLPPRLGAGASQFKRLVYQSIVDDGRGR